MNNTEEFNATLPDMHRERSGHVAVVVKKQIFVVGGYDDTSAESYDIKTKKWTVIKSMSCPRMFAAAVALGNNIVVMGGKGEYLLSSAEQYDTTSKQWSTFPFMNEARGGHAAAVLNGKVIVVGGAKKLSSSVEQYDPVTRRWTFLPPMIHTRFHCAAAVLDGQLYVAGGKDFNDGNLRDLSSVEVYNPNTNSWSFIENMKNRRSACAAVAWNGKLIVSGGYCEKGYAVKSVEIYDPKTSEWSSLPSMKTSRVGHAVVFVDGTLYAIGGGSENDHILSSMESLKLQPEFQPELQLNNTEDFNANLPYMHHYRAGHVAVFVKKKIFVVGGVFDATAESYDIETKKWTVINSISGPRFKAAAVALGNSIVVMGGLEKGKDVLSSAEYYDTTSKQWSTLPSMNEARSGHAAAVLNGKVIVVGGAKKLSSSVEQYDPVTRRWTSLHSMILKRSDCSAAVLDGQLYVAGGRNFDGGELSSVEVYNPNTNSWSFIENMKNRRSVCAGVAWNGKLIVLGGYCEKGNELKSVEIYDSKTCEWSSLPSMKTPRAGHTAVVVDRTLYAIGGLSENNQQLSSMESLELQPRSYSKFFEKLFEKQDRNVLFKCEELMTIVEDVHQMKFLYTFINAHRCANSINLQDCKRYITICLEKIALSTTCTDAIAIFKQLLDKAKQDGFINNHEYYSLESKAVVTHVGAAPFVKEIWKSIHGLQTRVTTLENRVDMLDVKVEGLKQVNDNIIDSIKMLQKGIRRKQKIEAVTGMMSVVLNSISFGLAGSAFQGAMGTAIGNIVDFGDISHIQTVVESTGDVTVHEAFKAGIKTVADRSDNALYDASRKSREILNEQDNPIFAIVVSAQLIAQAAPENNVQAQVQAQDNTLPLVATPTPPTTQTSIISRIKVLEESIGIEKTSSAVKSRVEVLEMSYFGEVQDGGIKERVSKLESEIM